MNALSNALQLSASSWPQLDAVARRVGVPSRQASMARAGKPINAGAHLALCAAVGIDPVDGTSRPAKELSPNVVWWLLSGALYIPFEAEHLLHRQNWINAGVLAANVFTVAFLAWRLWRRRNPMPAVQPQHSR